MILEENKDAHFYDGRDDLLDGDDGVEKNDRILNSTIETKSSLPVKNVIDSFERKNPLLSSPIPHHNASLSPPNIVIKITDFSPSMQDSAIKISMETLPTLSSSPSSSLSEMARKIKEYFESLFGMTWHCIIGKNFGSYVSHGIYIIFYKQT